MRQESLHPGLRQRINWQRDQHHDQFAPAISRAWQYLIESWDHTGDASDRDWYDLEHKLQREGWNSSTLRQFVTITRPYLKAALPLMPTPKPPSDVTNLRIRDLVRLEVEFPVPPQNANIADDWMERVIQGLRRNLEFAIDLCDEVDDIHLHQVCPIIPDDRPDISNFQRTRGLSGYVIRFAALFDRLIELDVSKAQQELSIWPNDDDTVFARLRFWATGKPELASPESFCQVVRHLSDDVFWGSYHQRDLMQVLAHRWPNLPEESRKEVENRLLDGPPKWQDEEDADYQERRAWSTLNRLQWLADNSCEFSFDLAEELAARRPTAPKWKPEYATHAADSREIQGGTVAQNKEHSALLIGPIDSILAKAQELSGRAGANTLEDRDPFAGLCAEHPRRAYLALVHAARRNDYPDWAWKKFLNTSPQDGNTNPRLIGATAERICRFPGDVSKRLLYVTAEWLQKNGTSLSSLHEEVFDRTVNRLIEIVQQEPQEADSALLAGGNDRDWATAALNSPVGNIAMSIVQDSRLEAIDGPIDPTANWLASLVKLLELNGNPRRHGIAILTHHLGWFYQLIPDWTEQHLLSIVDSDDMADKEAFWSGLLWNPNVTIPDLFRRIKPALLAFSKQKNASREGHVQSLAYLVLWGWIVPGASEEDRYITNDEFRDVLLYGGDFFRSQILWQFEQWLNKEDEPGLDENLAKARDFFREVWPRQMAVKSPQMSSQLVHLILSSPHVFAGLAEVVLPLLTKIERGHGLYMSDKKQTEIVNDDPGLLLRVLHVVLSEDVFDWPYGVAELLEKIGEVDDELVADPQLRELQRRWNAR